MKSPANIKNRARSPDRPRGRPRSVVARRAILKAAHELLAEGGLSSVTIEGIAARAGVGKPTIYRSWPNAHAVAMAALMQGDQAGEPGETPDEHAAEPPVNEKTAQAGANGRPGSAQTRPEEKPGSALAALRAQLHEVARVFSMPLGRSVALMIAASEQETELSKAFRNHFILARRNEGRTFLSNAIAHGEIRKELDLDVALDLIYAPVFYRLLMGHAPLSARFMDEILSLALQGLASSRKV
ncbi:MAG: TetR/AcrR family transcriptional regulator [Sinobacteraceae bacterium]|nr:TetR/AcrR family transcriptional regulator [Nevskiaceae bacterium]